MELLTADEDHDDLSSFALPSIKDSPVKVQSQLKRALYNNSRKRTHGASKTHMPDFQKMTSNDNEAMQDPYDMGWLKSVITNPMGESRQTITRKLAPDVISSLRGLSRLIKPPVTDSLLSEDVTFDDVDAVLNEESFKNAAHEEVVIDDEYDDTEDQ